jgi:hypothetical protein
MNPVGYQPGYDVERSKFGGWGIYRTTRTGSELVAMGKTTLGLVFAYWWRRLLRPIR